MKRIITLVALAGLAMPQVAQARKQPQPAWQVMRATDPVTGASTCAVVATDYVGKARFTRLGALYPVVEMNSTHGLLVGVSSGGRYRMPTGDIVWSVDGKPHREIKAADNPVTGSMATPAGVAGPQAAAATVAGAIADTNRIVQAMTATSTMASGDKAQEMLREMLAGSSLLFRAATPNAQIGLPNYQALMAGQVNEKLELKPIPIDASFREGLAACGIEI